MDERPGGSAPKRRAHGRFLQRRSLLTMAVCCTTLAPARACASASASAGASAPGSAAWLDEQFRHARGSVDLALFRLRVEQALSADVDVDRGWALVNAMAQHLNGLISAWALPAQRLAALRRFLYEPGPWNSHRPIRYDLAYALESDARHGFLHKLLTTRLGNCISMPTLFVALGHRLGLSMGLAQAPNHAFAVVTETGTGRDIRLETTSGAHPIRLASMRRAMPMSDRAIEQGVYLKKLDLPECMAMLAMPLLQTALRARSDGLAIALADAVLRHVPRNVDAMLAKGSAFAIQMERDFEGKYPHPAAMPLRVRAAYEHAHRQNRLWFQRAEALGWREPDPEAEARYRRHIQSLLHPNGENKP